MLNMIRGSNNHSPVNTITDKCFPVSDNRYDRNMQEDMKEAIDLLWKFKCSLDKLHPDVLPMIENMLQNRTRY